MTLYPPLEISARLLPAARVGDSWISIELTGGFSDDRRAIYRYYIDTPDFEFVAADIESGVGGGKLQDGLASLLSFLGAAASDYKHYMMEGGHVPDGESFPRHVCEWAYMNEDELSMLQLELDEKTCITD